MKWLVTLVLIMALSGCGGAAAVNGGNADRPGTDPVGTSDPTARISFSANPVRIESRMLSYAPQIGRLSLIDPDQARELWGIEVPGFDFAIAFPDLQGAALFDDQTVQVVAGEDRRTFPLLQPYTHTAAAAESLAYAVASTSGEELEIVRYLGSAGRWQHEVLVVPWINGGSSSPQDQPPLLASLFNANGTQLVAFRPADGAYTVFSAADEANVMRATGRNCAGDGIGTPEMATYRSFAWDEALGVVYAGDRNGKVYAFDPTGSCIANNTLPFISLSVGAVTHLDVTAPGELNALQDNGQLHQLRFNGTSFDEDVTNVSTGCNYPDGSISLGTNLHLITCLIESAPGSGRYQYKEYRTLDLAAGALVSRYIFDWQEAKNVVIDPTRRLMFRMEDNALGVLLRYDLASGSVTEQRGLFLDGILTGR